MLLCYVNTTLNLIIYFSSHNTSYLQFQKNILTHIMHCICNVKKYSCTELMLQKRASPFFSSLLTIICFRPFFFNFTPTCYVKSSKLLEKSLLSFYSLVYFIFSSCFFFIIVYTLHHELCSMCNILHPLYDAPKTNQQKNI